jgi:hypothetical protein
LHNGAGAGAGAGAGVAVVVINKGGVKGEKCLMQKEREREREHLREFLLKCQKVTQAFLFFFLAIYIYSQKNDILKTKSAQIMCFLSFSIAIIRPKF